MIKIYAGELDKERKHTVELERYRVIWWFGDDWKEEDNSSIITVFDKEKNKDFADIHINNENDIELANNLLKCLDIEIITDLKKLLKGDE